jgi:hypothetical protein
VMMFVYSHERKLILKFRKPKRLTGLEVHQDGVKRGNSLELQSVMTFVRYRLILT